MLNWEYPSAAEFEQLKAHFEHVQQQLRVLRATTRQQRFDLQFRFARLAERQAMLDYELRKTHPDDRTA